MAGRRAWEDPLHRSRVSLRGSAGTRRTDFLGRGACEGRRANDQRRSEAGRFVHSNAMDCESMLDGSSEKSEVACEPLSDEKMC